MYLLKFHVKIFYVSINYYYYKDLWYLFLKYTINSSLVSQVVNISLTTYKIIYFKRPVYYILTYYITILFYFRLSNTIVGNFFTKSSSILLL